MRQARLKSAITIFAGLLFAFTSIDRAVAQFDNLLGGDSGLSLGGGGIKLEVQATLEPGNAKPGDVVTLKLHVTLPPDNYTYPAKPSFGKGTQFIPEKLTGVVALEKDLRTDREPKVIFDKLINEKLEKFFDEVVFEQNYRIQKDANPADVRITGEWAAQVCDDRTCRDVVEPVSVALSGEAPAAAPTPSASAKFVHEESPEVAKGKGPGPTSWTMRLEPHDAAVGQTVVLSIQARFDEGWHSYSTTQPPGNAAIPTQLELDGLAGLEPVGETFEADRPPELKQLDGDGDIEQEVYEGEVTWTREFTVTEANYGVVGSARYQVCNERTCLRPTTVRFALGAAVAVAAPEPSEPPAVAVEEPSEEVEADPTKQGLVLFLLVAVAFGFSALLTPCVFPMVPITVSFFLKQSEKEHHRPVRMASIYCLGIIGTFLFLGVVVSAAWGGGESTDLANMPWLNLFIAGVLVFFGANLLGMFEIRVPAALLTWSSGKESLGGVIGTLFMAFTFTLVSFTCTFAFVGGLMSLAAHGHYLWPIIGMLAFSAAFASPFFFLALFPSYLQKLPKSGGWMNRVKVTTGLIEIAAALKFLSTADLSWNPNPIMFGQSTVLVAWIVISAIIGLYLLGSFRLPHDTPSESISPLRLMTSMGFLALAVFLGVGLFAPKPPEGVLWANIEAFLPARIEGGKGDIGPYTKHGDLKFALDVDQAIEYAKKNNQPLLLDFTGVNCVNCRRMEKKMQSPQNHERLKKFVLVQLYTDNVPTITDPELSRKLLEKNDKLQAEWFGDFTLPAYVVVTPDGQTKLATYKGLELIDGEFAAFLDKGYAAWEQRSGKDAAQLVQK